MPRILFYVDGPWPSAQQLADARDIGAAIRNARLVTRPERCDYVAGAVPECCAHLPRWKNQAERQEPEQDAGQQAIEPERLTELDVVTPVKKRRKRKPPSDEVADGADD